MTPDYEPGKPSNSPLLIQRIIWLVLLLGELNFLGILAFMLWGKQRQADPHVLNLMLYVLIGMAVVIIPTTWLFRARLFDAAREKSGNSSVPPGVYGTGNIIFWAGCEGVAFFGLVCTLLNNGPWPHLAVSIVAMAFQLLTFPTGGPMRGDL